MNNNYLRSRLITLCLTLNLMSFAGSSQSALKDFSLPKTDAQAEAVLQKAIQNLGGEKYLNVKTQAGRLPM